MLPSLLDALHPNLDEALAPSTNPLGLPKVSAAVLVVVDGLGRSNLEQMRGHARFLSAADQITLDTVLPTTTGAALTSLMTGALPGEHGLIGYRIRDERDGSLRSTLSDWRGVDEAQRWQRAPALLTEAERMGLYPTAIGRRAHHGSGLSLSILQGAEYRSAETIAQRFSQATRALQAGSRLVYVYIDELDRAAHGHGWKSDEWMHALEELDAQLRNFTLGLPADVGCIVTADHGVVDVPPEHHVLMDARPGLLDGVDAIGGEPRMRYLYLKSDQLVRVDDLVTLWRAQEGMRATIMSKAEACSSGMFGAVDTDVRARLGDVIVAAEGAVAYYTGGAEDEASRRMIGQHGGISAEEREVPMLRLGAFAGPVQR